MKESWYSVLLTETSMAYGIRVLFVNREAYRILAQGDTNVKLTLSVTWEGKKGEPIKHTISENSLISYGKKAYTQAANGNVTTAISITLKGLDSIVGKKLYVTANIASTTAVSGTEDYAVYTVPGAVTTPEEN